MKAGRTRIHFLSNALAAVRPRIFRSPLLKTPLRACAGHPYTVNRSFVTTCLGAGGGGTPCDDLNGKAPLERVFFLRLQEIHELGGQENLSCKYLKGLY